MTSGKVTPIPLGPSSVSPAKVQPPKSRRPSLSTPVNNAVSENDDDYYLQRSDSSDSKLQHDLLRGSSSGNFFSNKNRGVENPDDYDDTVRVASSKDVPKKTTKAPFRKLLTGKKPVAEASATTIAGVSSTTETPQRFAGSTTVRQPNYKPTTYRSKDRGRVNYKTYLDKQAKADEYDYQKVAKPSTQTTTFATVNNSYQPTTAKTNSAYQTTQVNNGQDFTQVNVNQPINNDFLRIAPINHNNHNGFQINRINSVPANNNNNNGFQSNRINSVPANTNNNNFQVNNQFAGNNNNNNFQTNNAFPANNNNNNFQANKAFPANNNNFQVNNAFPNNVNNNFQSNSVFPANNNNNQANNVFQSLNNNFQHNSNLNEGGNFQSEKLFTTTQNYNQSPTTKVVQTNVYQQQQHLSNTFQPNTQFQSGQTTQVYNSYQSPTAFQQSTNVFQSPTPYNTAGGNFFQQQQQQTSQQPQFQSTTEHFSKDNKAKFDPYSSYLHQRTNEEADELLKTAPSTNLRPSDLNALVQQAKPKSINATLSVGYSFNKADGVVAKSTVIVPAPTTQKPRPFTTQPAAAVTTSSSTTAFAAAVASSSTKKAVASNDKDSSYDYAYYDDSNHNDYTDVVPEDFSRINNAKKF